MSRKGAANGLFLPWFLVDFFVQWSPFELVALGCLMQLEHMHTDMRALEILFQTVELYLEVRAPVSSSALADRLGKRFSSATLRNVMASLEKDGFLRSLHASSGRLPTTEGLRLYGERFVKSEASSRRGYSKPATHPENRHSGEVIAGAVQSLAESCQCAGVAVSRPREIPLIRRIELSLIEKGHCLATLITGKGEKDSCLVTIPDHILSQDLEEIADYVNKYVAGRTVRELLLFLERKEERTRQFLHALAVCLLKKGIGAWDLGRHSIVVRGHSQLMKAVTRLEDVDMYKELFSWLETKESVSDFLESAVSPFGVQIFVGASGTPFRIEGCSFVLAPFGKQERCEGVVGIVGPSHMDYRKIVPIVESAANLVELGMA